METGNGRGDAAGRAAQVHASRRRAGNLTVTRTRRLRVPAGTLRDPVPPPTPPAMPRAVRPRRRPAATALACTLAALAAAPPAPAQPAAPSAPLVERPAWRAAFDSAGQRGVFVVRRLDSAGAPVVTSEAARARRGYLPASTFKIPNSLLALELGVVPDERHPFPMTWPRQEIAAWNRDHTFATALKYSVVPAYQIVARTIGEARYRDWLPRLAYGNADPSGDVATFWLDGALRTSAAEQVDFVARLAELRLPLSERSQRVVHDMLVVGADACHVLRAKTGLVGVSATRALAADERVGWYVGWVTTDAGRWAFALNVDADRPGASAARAGLARALLVRAGALPPRCGG